MCFKSLLNGMCKEKDLKGKRSGENVHHRVNEDKSRTWSNTVPEMCALYVTRISKAFSFFQKKFVSHCSSHSYERKNGLAKD